VIAMRRCISPLALRFPPRTVLPTNAGASYVIGYRGDELLIVSDTDAARDWQTAVQTRRYLQAARY
jgi:hypothetical protein